MSSPSASGVYGQNLADCFRLGSAPAFVSRSMRRGQVAVTHIVCDIENNGFTAPIPRQDAFLVTLQLRNCPRHDLWMDGKAMHTAPLAAGTTCIYDLRRSPVVNSISPFTNLHFYFSRSALEDAAEGHDISFFDDLPCKPGTGIEDPVIRDLGLSLLPAFDRPDDVSALFVDHVTSAVAAYVARLYPAHPADKGRKLAAWQQDRAREMLVSKPVADLSIAQVARECGMPLQQFVAAFKRSTGELPHEWLMKERARRNSRAD